MSAEFSKFASAVFANPIFKPPPYSRILALDPGETTGWSFFTTEIPDAPMPQQWMLTAQGQLDTWPIENCITNLGVLLDHYKPDFVVFERYAVYNWVATSHSWSEVPTIQVIGVIQTLCAQRKIKTVDQTAQVAKNFCKDDKLRTWGMYARGQRHARDSVRHGTYYILFGNRVKG